MIQQPPCSNHGGCVYLGMALNAIARKTVMSGGKIYQPGETFEFSGTPEQYLEELESGVISRGGGRPSTGTEPGEGHVQFKHRAENRPPELKDNVDMTDRNVQNLVKARAAMKAKREAAARAKAEKSAKSSSQ